MTQSISGIWHNQHGSTIRIEVSPDGRILGTFKSGTGLAKHGDERRVLGFLSGDLITFCVDFGEFDSMTAWVGHIVVQDGERCLDTQWQMAVALPRRESAERWKGIWTGTDVFRSGPVKVEAALERLPSHPLPDWP